MKYLILCVLFLGSSCSIKLYQLKDSTANKDFLARTIKDYNTKGYSFITPSLVIDGKLYKKSDKVKFNNLKLKKCELKFIHFFGNSSAKAIYGKEADLGIVFILTKKCDDNTDSLTITESFTHENK